MCAYENWHGGWSLGPRYLLPAVFLAAWPLAEVSRRVSRAATILFAAAAVAAASFFLFSSSTFWFYPAEPWNAPRFFSAFWLSRGWFVPTLAGTNAAGVALLAIASMIAAAAALGAFLPRGGDRLLAALAGAAVFALFFAGPPPRGRFEDRLTRARILESIADIDPDRGELIRLGGEAVTASDRAAWERAVAHYAAVRP